MNLTASTLDYDRGTVLSYYKLLVSRNAPFATFLLLLAITAFLYLQNLGDPYITLYDEGGHATVIKNLAEHCCVPHLHRIDLGTGYANWLNNTVWLHKPLLPFYVTAGVYELLGETLWSLRLPGVIFALLTSVVIYLTGRKFLNEWVGVCGAAIFCLNPYTHKQVRGLTFAGFPDLFLVFFTSVALYLILRWSQSKSTRDLKWLGLVVALAYMCKGGLALAPFAVLAAIALLTHRIRDLVPALYAVLIFIILVLPEAIYWRTHYPVEFRYEQQEQLLHLVRSIDGFGAPWYTYITFLLPAMLNGPLVIFAYFAIAWVLKPFRPETPGFILGLWVLAYVVPLSFAVSKIMNFVFPAFPALALLIPHVIERLLRARRFDLLLSLSISAVPMTILWTATYRQPNLQWVPLFATAIVFAATLMLVRQTNFSSKTAATSALTLIALVAVFSLYTYRDILDNIREPKDGQTQALLRRSAFQLKSLVGKDSLVLTHNNTMDGSAYLYIMYWSGVESLDICHESQPATGVARFRGWKNLYLISDEVLPSAPVAHLATGMLYSLDKIPFDVWSPVATEACSQKVTFQ